jgi:hypothetical protein
MLRSHAMTVGQLARRTGVQIKTLRTYEDLGFLSTPGASRSNYRLFGEEAVWCVQMVQGLRSPSTDPQRDSDSRHVLSEASCWTNPWRGLSPESRLRWPLCRRCVNASWNSRPPAPARQPTLLPQNWRSCWHEIHVRSAWHRVICLLTLSRGGSVYTALRLPKEGRKNQTEPGSCARFEDTGGLRQ